MSLSHVELCSGHCASWTEDRDADQCSWSQLSPTTPLEMNGVVADPVADCVCPEGEQEKGSGCVGNTFSFMGTQGFELIFCLIPL